MHAIYKIKDHAGYLKFLHKQSAVFVQPNDSKNYYAIKQREALAIFVAEETKPHIKILVFILKNFMLCCVVLFWLWLCYGMRCCLKRDRIHVTAFVHMLVADEIKLTFETLSGFFNQFWIVRAFHFLCLITVNFCFYLQQFFSYVRWINRIEDETKTI